MFYSNPLHKSEIQKHQKMGVFCDFCLFFERFCTVFAQFFTCGAIFLKFHIFWPTFCHLWGAANEKMRE